MTDNEAYPWLLQTLKGVKWVTVNRYDTEEAADHGCAFYMASDAKENLFRMWRIKYVKAGPTR